MDFLKLVRARYSVRQYQNRPVEPEKVEQLLEAAQAAPTAANCQPVRLLVVETPDGRRRLAGAAELYGAPLAWWCAPTGAGRGSGPLTASRPQTSTRPSSPTT